MKTYLVRLQPCFANMVKEPISAATAAIFFSFCLLPCQALPVEAQEFKTPRNPPRYGPWNQDLEVYESRDGISFVKRGTFVERGGVPCLASSADGYLYAVFQWFPFNQPEAFDRIAIVESGDSGDTWTDPQTIVLEGMPSNLARAFDPTLVVLPGGSLRLYFASQRMGQAQTYENQHRSQPHINRAVFSAISRDGIHYQFEPGQRFGFEDREAYDPSVVYFKGKWHLFCPASDSSGRGYHAISGDGLEFNEWEAISVPIRGTWIGNPAAVGDTLRFYGSGPQGVWMANSRDGTSWQLDHSMNFHGGDPTIVDVPGRGFLAVVTGPPREDAVPGPPPPEIEKAIRNRRQ